MIRRGLGWLTATVIAVAVFGCGERPQVVQYKQGNYQGKPDTPPYMGAPYNGNKAEWERAIKTRNQNQNEYKRTS